MKDDPSIDQDDVVPVPHEGLGEGAARSSTKPTRMFPFPMRG